MMSRCLQLLPVRGEKLRAFRAKILERMMFYSFTYLIFGLFMGCLYFLNYVVNRHYPSWDTDFLSSRILKFVCIVIVIVIVIDSIDFY